MKKKHLWIFGILTLLIFLSIPAFHILETKWNENVKPQKTPNGYANDASQLNLTKVDTIIQVPNDKNEIESQLKEILRYAKERNLKIPK